MVGMMHENGYVSQIFKHLDVFTNILIIMSYKTIYNTWFANCIAYIDANNSNEFSDFYSFNAYPNS